MRERRVKRNRKPTFFWQGILILAPMLVLAKIGALAIWQDKRMAEHDAELRAQDLAEQAAEKLAAAWTSHPAGGADHLLVDFNGELLEPKPSRSEMPAVEMESVLDTDQSNLLQRARSLEFYRAKSPEAIDLFTQFLATKPRGVSAQQARYSLGLLLASAGDATNAAHVYRELLREPEPAVGDAGGDLRTLALFKLAMLTQSGFDAACSNAVANPTPLTPEILRLVFDEAAAGAKDAAQRWWAIWEHDELRRRLWAELRPSFHSNRLSASLDAFRSISTRPVEPAAWVWVNLKDAEDFDRPLSAKWDASSSNSATSRSIELLSAPVDSRWFVQRESNGEPGQLELYGATRLTNWIANETESLRMPEYFGMSVSIGNSDVIRPEDLPVIRSVSGKGSGRTWKFEHRTDAPPAYATASRTGANALPFVARIHLIGPEMLFEAQRERSLWFRMLIGIAALTSIIGFASAYRAFHKQLRLAEMKSNFVSSVSHELRAPLASVRLMAEGLERGKISEPAKQQEYFRFITQECRRLSSMIENVLDFARIEQGRKQYDFEATNVAALVEQTVKLMRPYAEERGVRLVESIYDRPQRLAEPRAIEAIVGRANAHSSLSAVDGSQDGLTDASLVALMDGQAIQQALVNLIDNAIKHSPSGEEVMIELKARSISPNSGHAPALMLSVADHGPGIPASEHERIFERFYRLGSELRRETPGVGIGLSIVKHVVEAHGGRVQVESEVGQGSRFTIELPLTDAEGRRQRGDG